jgi:Tat protein translocase TatB subunit
LEIFGVGLPEILLIAVVALIILGPDRLPEAARSLGKGIADLRKAMEPARSAWADVQREINDTVSGTTPQVTTSGQPITGNPWTVHPLAEGLSDEERENYFKTGALPEWKLEEIRAKDQAAVNGSGPLPSEESQELDYPMPHAAVASYPESEVLDYPEPTHKTSREEH